VANLVTAGWKTYQEIDPSKTYVAYAAYVERKYPWSFFNYLLRAGKVSKQLNSAKGVVGFTARLEFFSKKVAQLAVFTDAESLNVFAHSGQHSLCSTEVKPTMNWIKNTTWNISGADLPPKLDEAIQRLQNQT
jgi:hypothetical protein